MVEQQSERSFLRYEHVVNLPVVTASAAQARLDVVAEELGKVADTLDSLVVTAPRRRIVGLVQKAAAIVPTSADVFPVTSAEVVNAV